MALMYKGNFHWGKVKPLTCIRLVLSFWSWICRCSIVRESSSSCSFRPPISRSCVKSPQLLDYFWGFITSCEIEIPEPRHSYLGLVLSWPEELNRSFDVCGSTRNQTIEYIHISLHKGLHQSLKKLTNCKNPILNSIQTWPPPSKSVISFKFSHRWHQYKLQQ